MVIASSDLVRKASARRALTCDKDEGKQSTIAYNVPEGSSKPMRPTRNVWPDFTYI